jgi:hypothetical protein
VTVTEDWPIDTPDTLRLETDYYPADALEGTECEGQRLVLLGQSDGNNVLLVSAETAEQWQQACDAYRRTPRPRPRFGTWRRYTADLQAACKVMAGLEWELTDSERALVQALTEYQPAGKVA